MTPLLEEVVVLLEDAIKAVEKIVEDAEDILGSILGGLLDLDAIVKIIADVLCVRTFFLLRFLALILLYQSGRPQARSARPQPRHRSRQGRYPSPLVPDSQPPLRSVVGRPQARL